MSTGKRLAATIILAGGAALLSSALVGCPSKTGQGPDSTDREAAEKTNEAIRARFLADNKLQRRVVLIEFGLIGCVASDKGLDRMIGFHRRNG